MVIYAFIKFLFIKIIFRLKYLLTLKVQQINKNIFSICGKSDLNVLISMGFDKKLRFVVIQIEHNGNEVISTL
ncbi:unnamed protein product [Paramecium pentaurelia]|uniref:Uncharacterized protein n=1 Tax=Paramecium pentaurelia TaxID=43138 RepID=A0A8S1STZ8_9CILI|nr:unnamed protein product [Paramecium pentaurelia]